MLSLLQKSMMLRSLLFLRLRPCHHTPRAWSISTPPSAQRAEIQRTAQTRAKVKLMGPHQHAVLGDALLGSTTHKVLHKATQPVLVVRIPDGHYEEGF
jgi:nucleotide-binding universal stress UspA family protein